MVVGSSVTRWQYLPTYGNENLPKQVENVPKHYLYYLKMAKDFKFHQYGKILSNLVTLAVSVVFNLFEPINAVNVFTDQSCFLYKIIAIRFTLVNICLVDVSKQFDTLPGTVLCIVTTTVIFLNGPILASFLFIFVFSTLHNSIN